MAELKHEGRLTGAQIDERLEKIPQMEEDIESLKQNGGGGGGGITAETDPTVPAWAKNPTKPNYTKSEIGLENVDNVKQYSASNPPPYPVLSINEKNGAVVLSASDVGADEAGKAVEEVGKHNVDENAHNDIRVKLSELQTALEAFLDIDDPTFDQLSELIQKIQANAGSVEQLTNGKINVADIVNNLTTNVANKPLSAAQGVVLKGLVDSLDTIAKGAASTAENAATKAQQASDDVAEMQERMDNGEFKGDTGDTGPQGPQGIQGNPGTPGADGVSIVSVEQTTTSTADGGENIVTVTLSNGAKSTFKFKNGSKGSNGVGIASMEQTSESLADGGENRFTVRLTDETSKLFIVRNGNKGSTGATGPAGKDGNDYVLTEADKAEIAGMVGSPIIPEYWETAVANATSKVKALQNLGGKDVVNFIHFADMHYTSGGTNFTNNLGSVAAKVMDNLHIPIMAGCGDMTRSGVATSSDLVTADVADALETLEPVGLENLLYCKGNHDGAWGSSAVYGTNYAMIQHPEKQWNNLFRWQAEDFRRVFSKDGSYFYIDNIPQKVRFIVLNSHWADYSEITDEDYNAGTTALNTQKNINYGDEQAEWLAKTALGFNNETDWTVVVFTHAPLWNKHNGVTKSYLNAGNAAAIRNILIGFYEKSSSVTYKSGSTVDYSGIDGSNTVAGVFTGHAHTDIATKYDEAGNGTNIPFPIITVTSAGHANASYEEGFGYPITTRTNGTDTETAFDVVCINKKTKTINTVRVGAGSDRSITYGEEEDVPVTLLSISATYTGGSVDVGTSINSLTGITVTAHYSDGSTETVTGYTLSGTISNEGNNTITVSYEGKTATFVVVGIKESGVPDVVLNTNVFDKTAEGFADNTRISSSASATGYLAADTSNKQFATNYIRIDKGMYINISVPGSTTQAGTTVGGYYLAYDENKVRIGNYNSVSGSVSGNLFKMQINITGVAYVQFTPYKTTGSGITVDNCNIYVTTS